VNAVVGGFAALVTVIAVGWVVGRTGAIGRHAAGAPSRASFYVATPALLLLTLADADPAVLMSAALAATAGSALGLAVLAGSHAGRDASSRRRLVTTPLRTPVVVGCGVGVLVAATGVELPPLVLEPVELTAALAVPAALLAVTVTSALPTAQNVFVYASSYDRGTPVARDVVLLTTVLSVPVLLVVALMIG